MTSDRVLPGILEIRKAIAEARLSPQEAIAACWARADERDPALRAFCFRPESMPDAGTGPLAGVAVGMKDLIDTADMPTSYGSRAIQGHRPAADAWIVERLRALGASILGKTVTTEFAWRYPGPTGNPWNLAHTPGGSSSGSAAAVGAGIVPLAVGTQTFGSVIRPAAFCGVVGFKPTFGTLPRDGVYPLSGSLDHVGLFARSVGDIAAVFALLAPEFAQGEEAGGAPRFGVLPLTDETIQPAQRGAFEAAVAQLKMGGVTVEPFSLPPDFAGLQDVADTIVAFEAARIFAPLAAQDPALLSADLLGLIETGLAIEESRHADALAAQAERRGRFDAGMAGLDGLLTIPASGEAPHGLTWTGDARFCVPWSLLGVPAITIPIGKGPSGLPLGLQIVGRWGDDSGLLTIAAVASRQLDKAAMVKRED